jgi:hypothetical protein
MTTKLSLSLLAASAEGSNRKALKGIGRRGDATFPHYQYYRRHNHKMAKLYFFRRRMFLVLNLSLINSQKKTLYLFWQQDFHNHLNVA